MKTQIHVGVYCHSVTITSCIRSIYSFSSCTFNSEKFRDCRFNTHRFSRENILTVLSPHLPWIQNLMISVVVVIRRNTSAWSWDLKLSFLYKYLFMMFSRKSTTQSRQCIAWRKESVQPVWHQFDRCIDYESEENLAICILWLWTVQMLDSFFSVFSYLSFVYEIFVREKKTHKEIIL